MKKTIFLVAAIITFGLSGTLFAQAHRDIAVAGHNRNNPNNLPLPAVNTSFSGWAGGAATFDIFTATPPQGFLKNKINGAQLTGCQLSLNLNNIPGIFDPNIFGGAELLFSGVGTFSAACPGGGNTLIGTFNRAILHVVNGSHSASVTLFNDSVTYTAGTTLINNLPGNYSFFNGSLSIAIITDQPVVVGAASINPFRGYSNVTFGARKL